MDFFSMAAEYRKTANKLKKTVDKYNDLAKSSKKANREHYNSLACNYRNLYYDTLNTAKLLEERGKKSEMSNKTKDKAVYSKI